jgi:hypothetical protein
MQRQIPDEVARIGALLRDPTARDLLESASLLFSDLGCALITWRCIETQRALKRPIQRLIVR